MQMGWYSRKWSRCKISAAQTRHVNYRWQKSAPSQTIVSLYHLLALHLVAGPYFHDVSTRSRSIWLQKDQLEKQTTTMAVDPRGICPSVTSVACCYISNSLQFS